MDFKIGDRAVYPAQGVTEILGLESKEIMGTKQDFYVLRVLDSDKKIMIPVDKVTSVGLREVMGKGEVKERMSQCPIAMCMRVYLYVRVVIRRRTGMYYSALSGVVV